MNHDNPLARSHHGGNGSNYSNDPWSRGGGGGALAPYMGGGMAAGGDAHAPVNPIKKVHRLLRGRVVLAAVLATIGAAAGAVVGYKVLKPQYRSDGFVEVRPIISNPLATERESVIPFYTAYVQSQANQMLTQRVITSAMETDEWKATGRGNSPEAMQEFIKSLDVAYMEGSFHIRVSYTDPDPNVGPAAVKSVIRSYMAYYGDVEPKETRDMMNLVQRSLDAKLAAKRVKEEQILNTAKEFGTDDLSSLSDATLSNMVRLQSQLSQARAALAMAEVASGRKAGEQPAEKKEWTESQILRTDTSGQMQRFVAARDEAKRSLDTLRLSGYGEAHQYVQKAKVSYELAQKQVEEYAADFRANNAGIQVGPNGQNIALQADSVDQLKSQVNQLEQAYQQLKEDSSRIGKAYITIKSLQTEVEQLKEDITASQRKIDQYDAELRMSMTGRIKVASWGDTPVAPFVDKRKQAGALGLVFGGAFPVGVLLLIGLMDQRYRYSDDAEEAHTHGMNLLGILPNLPDLLTDPKQASIAAHCVHQVRTMLQIRVTNDDSHVFSVTSASPGDGKTSLTLALGLSFAASGSRTLLVDCDLVGSALSRRLRIDNPEGILDAMAVGKAMGHVVETDIENLSVLPAGGAGLHHAGSFSPSALRRVIADARKNFDIVLIDTGPILGSVEATAVAASSDGVVLVVSRGQQRPLVERSVGQLHAVGARVAGVVFNRAEAHDFEKSVSRFSQRSIRPGEDGTNGNGNGFRRNGAADAAAANGNGHKGGYGPVAGAVATSFKPGNEYDNR